MSLCSATTVASPSSVGAAVTVSKATSVLPATSRGRFSKVTSTVPLASSGVKVASAVTPVDLPVSLSMSSPETVYSWPGARLVYSTVSTIEAPSCTRFLSPSAASSAVVARSET